MNTGVTMESKVTVGMGTGVNADVGTDLKSAVDTSGDVSTGVSVEVETGVGASVMAVGTGANTVADVETVPSACAVVSVGSALVGRQMNVVVEAKADMVWGSGMNMVVGLESETGVAADAEVNMSHFGVA